MASLLAVVINASFPRRERVGAALDGMGLEHCFATVGDAESAVARRRPDVVILAAPHADSALEIECLRRLRATQLPPSCLFLAFASSEDLAIAAFRAGAQEYLKEPWTPSMLQASVQSLLPADTDARAPADGLVGGERLVGHSPAIRQLRRHVARIASASSNVLILGETGTGKELIAELIHLNGPRAGKPLVCINTAAIPDALLENELFGHERGAFTGATTAQAGKFAAAHGGTVFLDEIGEVSPAIQAKLLRAIESKSACRLGGTRSVQLDIRIIAATNGDLERATSEGRFRRDLYYRLNVVRVEVPPLRDRVEDIPRLVEHYLCHFNRELGRSVRGLSPRAMETLTAYPWPGNVRELRNVVEALLVNLAPGTTGVVDVPPEIMRQLGSTVRTPCSERESLLRALAASNWNKTKAASHLQMSRMTLYRKLHQHSVSVRR